MAFLQEVYRGLEGLNQGLNVGCSFLNTRIGGLRRGTYLVVGGESKSGKTAFVDNFFVLNAKLLNPQADVRWYYYSNEITRIEKEAGMISTMMYRNNNLRLSADHILGREMNPDGTPKLVDRKYLPLIEEVYEQYITPLFGRYDNNDQLVEPGVINFIEYRENPTGVYNTLVREFEREGQVHRIDMGGTQVITGYTPDNPNAYRVLMVDHMRGLQRESGNQEKANIDTMSRYIVNLRNLFGMSAVVVIHLNRTSSDVQRIKLLGESLYPDADMAKDSGNLVEDCNTMINLFDPMDPKYGLERHFNVGLNQHKAKDYAYRTIHIVRNRGGANPIHAGFKFYGDVKDFNYIPQA